MTSCLGVIVPVSIADICRANDTTLRASDAGAVTAHFETHDHPNHHAGRYGEPDSGNLSDGETSLVYLRAGILCRDLATGPNAENDDKVRSLTQKHAWLTRRRHPHIVLVSAIPASNPPLSAAT